LLPREVEKKVRNERAKEKSGKFERGKKNRMKNNAHSTTKAL
jgi:hypothetical protein